MSVNTNNPANVGQYTVNYSGTYVSALGVTVALPPTAWALKVLCQTAFTLTTQPESPINYSVYPVSSTLTTTAAI